MAFGHFLLGLSQLHGHNSWLVCEAAFNLPHVIFSNSSGSYVTSSRFVPFIGFRQRVVFRDKNFVEISKTLLEFEEVKEQVCLIFGIFINEHVYVHHRGLSLSHQGSLWSFHVGFKRVSTNLGLSHGKI